MDWKQFSTTEKIENGLVVVYKNGKYGLYDEKGNRLFDLIFDYLSVRYGRAIYKSYGKMGVVDLDGKQILPCEYKNIRFADDQLLVKTERDLNGVADLQGNWVLKPRYYIISYEGYGVYDVNVLRGKYLVKGLVDKTGKTILEIGYHSVNKASSLFSKKMYDTLYHTAEQTFVFGDAGSRDDSGMIRSDGRILFKQIFTSLHVADCKGLVRAFHRNFKQYGLLAVDGTMSMYSGFDYDLLMDPYEKVQTKYLIRNLWRYKHGRPLLMDRKSNESPVVIIQTGKLYGLASKSGKVLTPPHFQSIRPWGEWFYLAKKDGKYGLLSSEGAELIPCMYDYIYPPDRGVMRFIKEGRHGLMNETGYHLIEPVCDLIFDFVGDIARITVDMVLDAGNYDFIKSWGKDGLIDRRGNVLLKPVYDYVFIRDDFILLENGEKIGLADLNGIILCEPCFKEEQDIRILPDGIQIKRGTDWLTLSKGDSAEKISGLIQGEDRVSSATSIPSASSVHQVLQAPESSSSTSTIPSVATAAPVDMPAVDFEDAKFFMDIESKFGSMEEYQWYMRSINALVNDLIRDRIDCCDSRMLDGQDFAQAIVDLGKSRNEYRQLLNDLDRLTKARLSNPDLQEMLVVQILYQYYRLVFDDRAIAYGGADKKDDTDWIHFPSNPITDKSLFLSFLANLLAYAAEDYGFRRLQGLNSIQLLKLYNELIITYGPQETKILKESVRLLYFTDIEHIADKEIDEFIGDLRIEIKRKAEAAQGRG